jgi:hypothetical protein
MLERSLAPRPMLMSLVILELSILQPRNKTLHNKSKGYLNAVGFISFAIRPLLSMVTQTGQVCIPAISKKYPGRNEFKSLNRLQATPRIAHYIPSSLDWESLIRHDNLDTTSRVNVEQ